MEKPISALQKAALLRDKARQALRLANGLLNADRDRLTAFAGELREQATELERQAAAEVPQRPAEPKENHAEHGQEPNKGRGGSNDPEPQT